MTNNTWHKGVKQIGEQKNVPRSNKGVSMRQADLSPVDLRREVGDDDPNPKPKNLKLPKDDFLPHLDDPLLDEAGDVGLVPPG